MPDNPEAVEHDAAALEPGEVPAEHSRPGPNGARSAEAHGRLTSAQAVARLREMRERAYAGGGERRIQQQHAKGKLTARERIDLLLALPVATLDRQTVAARLKEIGRGEGATAMAKAE